jgi:hypothetical protein
MGVDVGDILRKNLEKDVRPDEVKRIMSMFEERSGSLQDLATKKFESPEALFSHFDVKYPGLFTKEQSIGIWNKLRTTQMGGAMVMPNINDLLSPTISSALDALLGIFIPEVRTPIKFVLGFVFILSFIEKLPLVGPLLSAALDVASAILPTAAVALQSIVPGIFGLIPLPYASMVGLYLGWLFSAILLYFTMLIGISRKQFGDSVVAIAGMVPLFGPTLMTTVKNANVTAAKLNQNRIKIVNSFSEVITAVTSALSQVGQNLGEKTKTSLTNIVQQAQTKAKMPTVVGGRRKRLSSRKRKNSKWGTMRNKSVKH